MTGAFIRSAFMMNTGLRNRMIAAGLGLAIVIACAGCSDKIYSNPDMTSITVQTTVLDPLSFQAIDAKMREFNFGINEYMREHADEATIKISSGATVNGVAANCKYTISPDGKYEALQMEKKLSGATQVDEYFNADDAVFITRTTMYDDGNFDPVDKYYIKDGAMYKVDSIAETVTKVADITGSSDPVKQELDIYLSFDEIRTIYA